MAGGKKKIAGHSPVIIIGGGIIGLCTAYYLSLTRGRGDSITVVENTATLFAGASSKANGILGDYGFEPQAEPLGELSWKLHQRLASQHNGRASWGYRGVMIYDLQCAASSDASNGPLGSNQLPSTFPDWCRHLKSHNSKLVSNHEHAARINPMEFGKFLQKSCEEMGVQILLGTTVKGVGVDHGSLKSVTITSEKDITTLECHSLVIAAGPWSEGVLSGLFPNSRVHIPSSRQPNSGIYLLVRVPGWKGCRESGICHQIYFKGFLSHDVNISSRPDGTLYVGEPLSAQEDLPETATDVSYQSRYVRMMKRHAERVLGLSSDDVVLLDAGRAYRPCLEYGRPIITQVPLDELLGMTHGGPIEGWKIGGSGVYLNVGHGYDGITLGPGSGKVMSELIEGLGATSADISGLGIL